MQIPKAVRLPSGKYRARVYLGGKCISITRSSEADVMEAVLAAKREYKTRNLIRQQPVVRQTVGEILDDYIERRRGVASPSTIRGYATIRRTRFTGLMDTPARLITNDVLQKAVNAECRTRSPKTVRSAWSLVASALQEAGLERPKVNLPAKEKNTRQFFDREEMALFLEAIKKEPPQTEIAALLALHSLRRSEIVDIQFKDIDANYIHVRGAAVLDENGLLTHKRANKTTNSKRDIPIIIPRLKEIIEANRGKPNDYVITLYVNTLYKQINRVCQRAGLPCVGMHGLRHTFASVAIESGAISQRMIMQLGGWDSSQTLLEIYAHVNARMVDDAGKKLAAAFASKPQTDTKTDTNGARPLE